MTTITRGVRSVLSVPLVYQTYQRAVGSKRSHQCVIDRLDIRPGHRVLDVGCGPADIVTDLPDVEYVGLDVSDRYIAAARTRFGRRGSFVVADLAGVDAAELGEFDRVIAHGLLHHVPDDIASNVCRLAAGVLVPTGRFVTLDGCFHEGQSRFSRFLVAKDRGTEIRTIPGYLALARPWFGRVDARLETSLFRVPYSIVTLECSEPLPRGPS